MNRIGRTSLEVFPLCLGGNVFGWTADEPASFAVLDAYVDAGGNFVDTADSYSVWANGNEGGESETIIGRWLTRRRRDDVVIATKVGQAPGRKGLSAANIAAAAEASLQRLGVGHIDLYYAHEDDPTTPIEETLAAFDELVRAGKVRHVGTSNYSAPRLAAALTVAAGCDGTARYEALQVHYNLVHRDEYEGELASLCTREQVSCVAYSALADGFLTGKYRRGRDLPASERAEDAAAYLTPGGVAVLDALDTVAARHDAPVAAVALAWLMAQPTVAAALASARTPEQLADLLRAPDLRLADDDLTLLAAASP